MSRRTPLAFLLSSVLALGTLGGSSSLRAQTSGAQSADELLAEAETAFREKRYEDAARLFEASYRAGARDPGTLYNAAFAARKGGAYDDAVRLYREYRRVDPANSDGLFGLAETERLRGNTADAGALFRVYLDVETRAEKASYREWAERYAAAPKAKPSSSESGVDASFRLGVAAYREKQFEAAARHFADSYAKTKDPQALLRQALALRKAGRYPEALAAYGEFIKVVPDDADGVFGRAETHRLMGADDEARAGFTAYVEAERRPDRATYVEYAKEQLAGLGTAEAKGAAQDLVARADKAYGEKDFPGAAALYQQAYANDPANLRALYRSALSLRKAGNLGAARAAYLAYLELNPSDPDAHYGLAETARQLEDVPAARRSYARYVELETRPSESAYVARAQAYLAETAGTEGEAVSVDARAPVVEPASTQNDAVAPTAAPVVVVGVTKGPDHDDGAGPSLEAAVPFGGDLAIAELLAPSSGQAVTGPSGRAIQATAIGDGPELRADAVDALLERGDVDAAETLLEADAPLAVERVEALKARIAAIEAEDARRAGPDGVWPGDMAIAIAAARDAGDVGAALSALAAAKALAPCRAHGHCVLEGEVWLLADEPLKAIKAFQRARAGRDDGDALYGLAEAYARLGDATLSRRLYRAYLRASSPEEDAARRRRAFLAAEGVGGATLEWATR